MNSCKRGEKKRPTRSGYFFDAKNGAKAVETVFFFFPIFFNLRKVQQQSVRCIVVSVEE